MNVLGIETSCDETAAAIVNDKCQVLSSVVFSQVACHAPYGGVVPEIASRKHEERLAPLIDDALRQAGLKWEQLDAVAVTYGPGLAGSLIVGLAAAKGLAMRLDKPLVAINHLEAHLFSPFLSPEAPGFNEACPFLGLIVSGGHTCLVRVEELGRYSFLGSSIDDAAGEAFDKGAQLLGLGYPGGPAIDRVSEKGNSGYISFPRGKVKKNNNLGQLQNELCFSFSGLKTSLRYYLQAHPCPAGSPDMVHIAASYQEAIVDALVARTRIALRQSEYKYFVAVGGVSLNRCLRAKLLDLAAATRNRVLLPMPQYCIDNAAMVTGLAAAGGGITGAAAWQMDACPNQDIA